MFKLLYHMRNCILIFKKYKQHITTNEKNTKESGHLNKLTVILLKIIQSEVTQFGFKESTWLS